MIEITKELLGKWFSDINAKYFNNELRKPIRYIISKNKSRFGQFNGVKWTIEMSVAYIRSERDYYNTFLHEICHLYVRQKHGGCAQSHGPEWKRVAKRITDMTQGKYGTIQRVGGGQDKYTLRPEQRKKEKFVVFTDSQDRLCFAKYSNDLYVEKLKKYDLVKPNTTIYCFISNDINLCLYTKRSANAWAIRWDLIPKGWTIDTFKEKCELVKTETFYGDVEAA